VDQHFPALNGAVDQMSHLADVMIAGVLLAITLPLMLFVALAIRCESPGPILCRHSSIGCGGHRFKMLAFRITAHDPEQIAPTCQARTLTRVGWFLHSTRIDALPQLLNVMRGEMSLIDRDGCAPSFLN